MKINNILREYSIVPSKYQTKGNAQIITTKDNVYVYKENKIKPEILNYLKSRNFDYFPKIISSPSKNYRIEHYIEDLDIPKEQKILDMVTLVSLLHSKTTHYKETTEGDINELYDKIKGNIDYLYSYYNDIITTIENKVYMSPAEYALARNISVVFSTLNDCQKKLDSWKNLANTQSRSRSVINHGNLKLEHFIRNEKSYLINWDKAKIDSPVFDIYTLYKNHALDFDFTEILNTYEQNYPLLEEEKQLLYLLISLPEIPTFNSNNYNNAKNISNIINMIYKTNEFTKKT